MFKMELRKKYKELRQELTSLEIEGKSMLIANNLLKLNIWDKTYYHSLL